MLVRLEDLSLAESDKTTLMPPQTIVVIGAGVLGLTSALRLQDLLEQRDAGQGTEILIVAREWPAVINGAPSSHSIDYASMWAGAHVRPIPASTPQLQREATWVKQTCVEFDRTVKSEPWAGVTRTPGVEYLEAPPREYQSQTKASFETESGLSGYRKLPSSELPEGVVLGFEYDSFSVNPPLYCSSLLRKFLLRGGKTLKRDLRCEEEALQLLPNVAFVINASGIGFGDRKSFPTRGQTVVTNVTSVTKTVTRQNKDGSWSFVIPRSYDGGTIVGGTKEPNNWQTEPSDAARNRLLARGEHLIPLASDGPVPERPIECIADIVGRRPTREGGMRLEVENRTVDQNGRSRTFPVLHAYGAGGRGYEMSWGIANEVGALAERLLSSAMRSGAKL